MTLVHCFSLSSGSRTFNKKKLSDAESAKVNQYREPYKPNCVFVPLAADSLGRIGDQALRFFRFLATKAPACPSSGSSPPAVFSFHSLRLRFLFDSLEATADRITRRRPVISSVSLLRPLGSPLPDAVAAPSSTDADTVVPLFPAVVVA